MSGDMNDFRDMLDVKFEAMRSQHADLSKKMDLLLVKFDESQGRITAAEGDIIRLQERTNPGAASALGGGIMAVVAVLVEYLRHGFSK